MLIQRLVCKQTHRLRVQRGVCKIETLNQLPLLGLVLTHTEDPALKIDYEDYYLLFFYLVSY